MNMALIRRIFGSSDNEKKFESIVDHHALEHLISLRYVDKETCLWMDIKSLSAISLCIFIK